MQCHNNIEFARCSLKLYSTKKDIKTNVNEIIINQFRKMLEDVKINSNRNKAIPTITNQLPLTNKVEKTQLNWLEYITIFLPNMSTRRIFI